ncbi:MAG TPA: hypothetical protein VEW64_03860 [Methyloceanibacter sp.]|jgi:hypothetical protein|nr:hypothetical protein [Methyloceanibacter sp.]
MFGSKYLLTLIVVAGLAGAGFSAKSAFAEDAPPGDQSVAEPQGADAANAAPRSPLRVNSFDYEDAGDNPGKLKVAGIALPNNELFLFFDDQPIATVVPDDSGNWSVESELKFNDGRHTLRAEQFDPETRMLAARAMISIERSKQPDDGPPKP